LDGTDFRLLTNTSNTSEVQPNLCSANQKIVFGEFAAKEIAVGVLWVMNSDGSDVVALLYEEGMRYEEPIWSPDCQYIAFGSRQRDSDRWRINFINYEDPEKTVFNLGEGQYPTWVPDSHQLVFNRLGNPSGVSSFLTTNLDDCDIDYSTHKSECKVSPYPEGMTPRGKQPSISQSGLLLAYASFPIEIDTSGEKYYQI
jgi:Tol biopolymer transport system component